MGLAAGTQHHCTIELDIINNALWSVNYIKKVVDSYVKVTGENVSLVRVSVLPLRLLGADTIIPH